MNSNTFLKSIIYCPSKVSLLDGSETHLDDVFTEVFAAGIRPHEEDFENTICSSRISLTEVPDFLGSPPGKSSLPWHQYPGVELLEEAIQYHFSDNTIISCREILYHPYSVVVPLDLLPLMTSSSSNHFVENSWLSLLPGEVLPLWGSLRKTELILIQLLIRASRYADIESRKNPIEIWITHSPDRTIDRKGLRIYHTQCSGNFQSHWKVKHLGTEFNSQGKVSLEFVEKPFFKNGKIFQSFEIDPIQHSLIFHPEHKKIEMAFQLFNLFYANEISFSSAKLTFEVEGHSKIQSIIHNLDQKLITSGFTPVQIESIETIPASSIEPQLWISSHGDVQFCRKFISQKNPQEIFSVWNLPQSSAYFVKGLTQGLGSLIFDDESKILANVRKGIKRDRDLKIYKHMGIFNCLFLETAHYVLKKQTLFGTPLDSIEDFLTYLYKKIGQLLYEIEKKSGFVDVVPAPTLDKVCSQSTLNSIEMFVREISSQVEQNSDQVFLSSGKKILEGSSKHTLQFFHALLVKVALSTKGQCFFKPRFNLFSESLPLKTEATPETNPIHLLENKLELQITEGNSPNLQAKSYSFKPWFASSEVLYSFLNLRGEGFSLFYNGFQLSEMNAEDFTPEFQLIENEIPVEQSPQNQPIDWFELNPKFFFKGIEMSSHQISQLSEEGMIEFQGKVYLIPNKSLPSIKRLEIFWSKIQSGYFGKGTRKTEETYYPLPKSQTLEMLALRASGITIKGGERWNKICKFYDNLAQERPEMVYPPTLQASLKPYQKIGLQWLIDLFQLGLGGVLADDMGLGKTIQTLSFLECLRASGELKKTLIIVPTSLTYNWLNEANRFTPELPILIFQSKNKSEVENFLIEKPHCALISTYGLFTEHIEFFEKYNWNILIFDEAQNLKNISAKRTTASRKISAYFKLCLTGTPLENHLGEFYSLLDLVVPGSLGDLSKFRQKFVSATTIDPEEIKYLKLKSRPLVLRRSKSEILSELPPKIESTVKLPFESKQEKIYRDIALSWNEKVKESILEEGEAKSQLLMLTALLRLRQACSDPGAIPQVKYNEEPPKISVLIEALQEITESGESALVFTQFIHTFERVKRQVKEVGIDCFSIHGKNTRVERERNLQSFHECKKGSVLLMTLKTGGVGLNLVKASYVFHLEPWWNPAVENQATDRAYRIGQQKPVQVYRYIMRESVEEKIEILKERKSARFNSLFSTPEGEKTLTESINTAQGILLTQADFEYLLS